MKRFLPWKRAFKILKPNNSLNSPFWNDECCKHAFVYRFKFSNPKTFSYPQKNHPPDLFGVHWCSAVYSLVQKRTKVYKIVQNCTKLYSTPVTHWHSDTQRIQSNSNLTQTAPLLPVASLISFIIILHSAFYQVTIANSFRFKH